MLTAMVKLVGEQGYAATTVADVIACAGASRRTFYKEFSDRQACFLMASDQIVAHWVQRIGAAVDDAAQAQEDAVEAFVGEFFQASLASPAALRLLTAELAAVGQPGIDRRERFLAGLSRTLHDALAMHANRAPKAGERVDWRGGDALVPYALVGATLRILYARMLRAGRVRRPRRSELIPLIPDVAQWITSYRSAPAPTLATASDLLPVGGRAPGTLSLGSQAEARRGLPRGEGISRSFVVHSQRERLLDAIANLSAAAGYGEVTIPQIVQEAAVSVQAFYEHFSDREDTLLVAYELGHRKALALVERAYSAQQDWPTAVYAALDTLLSFLASEPSFTHVALVDAPAAGSRGASLAQHGAAAYAELLKPTLDSANEDRTSHIATEASVSAVHELCYLYATTDRAQELPSLIDLAMHIVLTPCAAAPSTR